MFFGKVYKLPLTASDYREFSLNYADAWEVEYENLIKITRDKMIYQEDIDSLIAFDHFYENSEGLVLSYEINGLIIDRNADALYYEESLDLISDELKAKLNEEDRISWIYANGRLDAEYADFNNDGHTDMRFYGIRKTMVDKDEDSLLVIAEEFYMMLFLFDPESNEFVLDREEVIPLNTTEDYLFSYWG